MKLEDTIDQLEKWNIILPSTTAKYKRHWQVQIGSFFRETKYLDLGAGMVSSGVFLRIGPYIFSNANLNFWKFHSRLVCPTDLIEPKWIDLILASQWMPNSSRPFRHFRSQMMLILIKLIHSSTDIFFYSVDGHGKQVILSTWSGGFWNQTPRIIDGTVVSYDVTQSRYSPKPWLFCVHIYIYICLRLKM